MLNVAVSSIISDIASLADVDQPQKSEMIARSKQIGVLYWVKLMREGIPRQDSRTIAAAIAKFKIAERQPNSSQKRLISQYSASICRAGLWDSRLLQ